MAETQMKMELTFFRKLKKKGLKRFFFENILDSKESNARKACSIALGVFIGIAPFWGFQTILVLAFAVLLKLNKAIAFAFSNISFPPFIPFVIYGSLKMGSYFVSNNKGLDINSAMTFEDIQKDISQYLIGSFILATLMAILFGVVSYLLLTFVNNLNYKKL